jgi:hypothetical protein
VSSAKGLSKRVRKETGCGARHCSEYPDTFTDFVVLLLYGEHSQCPVAPPVGAYFNQQLVRQHLKIAGTQPRR